MQALQVVWLEARMLGNSRQHLRPDILAVMEGENEIRPAIAGERSVGPRLPLKPPPNAEQGGENTPCLSRWPLAHAAATEILIEWARLSPCSRRSAKTRKANTSALAIASSGEAPYASTPASCGTSASHRPSSSRSHSMLKSTAHLFIRSGRFYALLRTTPNMGDDRRPVGRQSPPMGRPYRSTC